MKILKSLLYKFRNPKLPEHFEQNEKIPRTIFSPINLNNNKTKIKSNAFKPRVGTDGVSVNRLSFTTMDYIKKLSKEITGDNDKEYFGFGILKYHEIIECHANVEYTPLDTNKFHADIKIGFIPQKRGDTLPSEYSQKTKRLAEKAKLYIDPNPGSDKWEGVIIE